MAPTQPQVPIEVDSETGVWSTDGQPMIYLPRHFYVNHHDLFARALGEDAYAKLLYEAGHTSAWQWCAREAATHSLRGVDVFVHYMRRISQRGWGQFSIDRVDAETGEADVQLAHSIYVSHHGGKAGRRLCYGFAGWFPGALEWAGRDLGLDWRLAAREVICAADGAHNVCRFEIRRRAE